MIESHHHCQARPDGFFNFSINYIFYNVLDMDSRRIDLQTLIFHVRELERSFYL